MTEEQLVKDVALRASLTQRGAADAVVAVIDAIMSGVMEGHQVVIPLFGTFDVEALPDRTVPRFQPDDQFIRVVRGTRASTAA